MAGKNKFWIIPAVFVAVPLGALLVRWLVVAPDSGDLPPIERIILITLDTLRADHLGCYGYPRPTSPFIDELAKESVIFKKPIAQIPLTVPSHASLFTARYPTGIGVLNNGHRLDDSYLTLAEFMKGKGYSPAAFVSTHRQFSGTNLNQGFEYFDEPPFHEGSLNYRPAAETVARVMEWMNGLPDSEQLFLWIHLFDTHHPYYPPRKYYDLFAETPAGETLSLIEPQEIDLDLLERLSPHEIGIEALVDNYCDGEKGGPSEALVKLINAYDGEIRYLDEELRRLYNRFEATGLNKNALWIITADHGEGLGQHGWIDHGVKIYNEAIHVPLIFHFPSGEVAPRSEEIPVELVDVFPTVAALLGLDIWEEGKIMGHPLTAAFNRKDSAPLQYQTGKKLAFSRRSLLDDREELGKDWEPGDLYSIQDGSFKYFYRTQGEPEFYDLRTDPHETKNLSGKGGRTERNMKTILLERVQKLKAQRAGEAPEPVDQETLVNLKALGYVN